MSRTSLLVLALAGLLLVTFPSICGGGGSAAYRLDQCRGDALRAPNRTGYTCGECCKPGHIYETTRCSPPVSGHTKAIMTLGDFDESGDFGARCDGEYHTNRERVVTLSTGWYQKGKRCRKDIRIHAKGRSVLAKVVDECDSLHGCDSENGYLQPCRPNIVEASQAVWDALEITGDEVGEYPVTWSDA